MITWIAVTSGARARIFETRGRLQPLTEISDMVNPEDRLRKKELRNDKPGRATDAHRGQRHTVGMADNPKDQVARDFARSLVERLTQEAHKNHFDRLCVVAPPRFMGMLREQMSAPVRATLAGEITKDLTAEAPARIHEQVAEVLWPQAIPVPGLPR
jgi:protein required for attachment to host cells